MHAEPTRRRAQHARDQLPGHLADQTCVLTAILRDAMHLAAVARRSSAARAAGPAAPSPDTRPNLRHHAEAGRAIPCSQQGATLVAVESAFATGCREFRTGSCSPQRVTVKLLASLCTVTLYRICSRGGVCASRRGPAASFPYAVPFPRRTFGGKPAGVMLRPRSGGFRAQPAPPARRYTAAPARRPRSP
jgi:hypothetical protein